MLALDVAAIWLIARRRGLIVWCGTMTCTGVIEIGLAGIGPMITHAAVPHTWVAGLTELPDGGRLLVSRGIGVERGHAPPMRFLCRPELMVIDLTPEEKGAADERH